MRLPNLGAVKWRKADNSGDLGMALNANDQLAMDAIIDFAAGQTFGAFSYPDATTTARGSSRSIRSAGFRWTRASVGRRPRRVTPGTYTKLTVDFDRPRHGWRDGWWHPTCRPIRTWPPTCVGFAAIHDPERPDRQPAPEGH